LFLKLLTDDDFTIASERLFQTSTILHKFEFTCTIVTDTEARENDIGHLNDVQNDENEMKKTK